MPNTAENGKAETTNIRKEEPTPNSLPTARLRKLQLEIDALQRGKSHHEWISKTVPVITSLVAVVGLLFTILQAQRTDILVQQQQERDRRTKIQAQIRADKEQLTDF